MFSKCILNQMTFPICECFGCQSFVCCSLLFREMIKISRCGIETLFYVQGGLQLHLVFILPCKKMPLNDANTVSTHQLQKSHKRNTFFNPLLLSDSHFSTIKDLHLNISYSFACIWESIRKKHNRILPEGLLLFTNNYLAVAQLGWQKVAEVNEK